jgi:SPP1 family predicted phage head-tail adaptor
MAAGELRDRVTFFSPTKTTDVLRGQTVTYTREVCTVAAHWRGLTTRETLLAQGLETQPAARLVVRYRDDLTTQLRAQRNGAGPLYEVASVNDYDGRKVWLDIDLVAVP